MKQSLYVMLLAMIAGCGADSSSSTSADAGLLALDGHSETDATSQVLRPDATIGLALQVVPGKLTYAANYDGQTHIYSTEADGANRIRLTQRADNWSFHSVSPSRRYLAMVAHDESTAAGMPNVHSRGTVWILDIRTADEYALTPQGCNAGVGGLSWLGDAFVTFAMSCDGEPSKAYLAAFDDKSRDVRLMLAYAEHMFPVRSVSAALHTSRATYVVDQTRCVNDVCVVKPQIWLADTETMQRCQVTDADRDFLDTTGHSSPVPKVGDHTPVFTDQLRGIMFSRNVPSKGAAPTGHHDIMRVGLNMRALDSNEFRCELPGTEANLSDQILGDDAATVGADGEFINELYPQPTMGDETSTSDQILFVGRDMSNDVSRVYLADMTGGKRAVSLEGEWVVYTRWILSDLALTGER
jgi:hypothetical protein